MEVRIDKKGQITLKMDRSHAALLLSTAAISMQDVVKDIGNEDNITSQVCRDFAKEFWAARKIVQNI